MEWKELNIKDKIQYIMAIALISSGITLAFVSFAFTNDVANGVLIYISEAFITAGGIFGISIYFKDKLSEYSSQSIEQIKEIIKSVLKEKGS